LHSRAESAADLASEPNGSPLADASDGRAARDTTPALAAAASEALVPASGKAGAAAAALAAAAFSAEALAPAAVT